MENLESTEQEHINGDNPFQSEPEVSLGKNALIYGAILGGITVFYSIMLWIFGLTLNKTLGYVSLLFTVGVMYYGTKEYRDKQLGGYMMYGQAFTSNFLISLYSCIIGAVYTFFLYKFIDPTLIATILQTSADAALQSNPNLTSEQIDQMMSTIGKYSTPTIISLLAFFGGAIFSALLGLLVAIFHKKEMPLV